MSKPDPLIEHLYEALQHPLGTIVVTDDPERLRQRLYKLRREDEAFACLSFVIDREHPTSRLLIVRKPNDAEDEAPEAHA